MPEPDPYPRGAAPRQQRSELIRAILASVVRERRDLVRQGASRTELDANRRALVYWRDRYRMTRLPV